MRGNSSIIMRRFLVQRHLSYLRSPISIETQVSPSRATSSPNSVIPKTPFPRNYISTRSTEKFPSLRFHRTLCSSPDGPSNIILIKSGEEFDSSLTKVKDESLAGIFYFTAAWCGPCRFISPVIGELSAQYPHVKTYKIDIDQEGLGSTLSKLNITAVPTLLFFQNGEKVAGIVGADIQGLKDTMEKLYKKD